MNNVEFLPEDFEGQPDYFKMSVDMLVSISDTKLSMLFDYIDNVEVAIKGEIELIQKKGDKVQNSEYADYLNEERIIRSQNWPEFLYRTIVITVHIVIEKVLNDFCKEIQLHNNLKISLKDIRGSGFKRAIIYLDKLANIQISNKNPEWKKLMMLKDIRNIIIHNDSIVPENDNATPIEILNSENIKIDDLREISLSAEYCKDMICTAGRFIHNLRDKIVKIK